VYDPDHLPLDYRPPQPRKRVTDKLRRALAWGKAHRSLLAKTAVVSLLFAVALGWIVYPYLSFDEAFRRSRPALEAYAEQVKKNGPATLQSPPAKLGYFKVNKVEALPHGFLFQSNYGNPFDWDGIAYSTAALPRFDDDSAGKTKQVFEHIDGNWYSVFRP
jgi:hypothetical protein